MSQTMVLRRWIHLLAVFAGFALLLSLAGCAARQTTGQPIPASAPQPAEMHKTKDSGSKAAPTSKSRQAKGSSLEKRAFEAMQRGDVETGIRLYEQVLRTDPDNGRAYYHLGYGYGQIGDLEKEITCYRNAISLGYRKAEVYRNLGNAYRWS